jgi:hypothetical protein
MIQLMWQELPSILIGIGVLAFVVWMAVSIESTTSPVRFHTGGPVGQLKEGQSIHILDTEQVMHRDDPRLRCMLGGFANVQNYAGAPDLPNRDPRIALGDEKQGKPANVETAQTLAKLRRMGLDIRVVSAYRTPGWLASFLGAEPTLIGVDYIAGDMVLGTSRHVRTFDGMATHTTWSQYVRTMLSEEYGWMDKGDVAKRDPLPRYLRPCKVKLYDPDAVAAKVEAREGEQAVVDAMRIAPQSGAA